MLAAGAPLAEVACAGRELLAEMSVSPGNVGRLRADQDVKLLYDAFPYERYGVRFGKLAWVSPASVDGPNGPSFRAIVRIPQDGFVVQGALQPLRAGLGGHALVVVDRQRVLFYAFEPLRALRESMASTPR